MAKEKTKYDILDKIPDKPKKTKKNKHKTECSVNRRDGCGICGSLNTCVQGVIYCPKCGAEEEILTNSWIRGHYWRSQDDEKELCKCTKLRLVRNMRNKIKEQKLVSISTRQFIVEKCIDCGAVRSNFCPNNKKHYCWQHWDGRKYCINCGYRKS